MGYWIFVGLVLIGIVIALLLPGYRLKKAIAAPFPDEWVTILERNIAVYRNLPMPLRLQLRTLIKQFLHEKNFSGANGLEITDDACRNALSAGTIRSEVVLNLITRELDAPPIDPVSTPERLCLSEEPLADCDRYDSLREEGCHATT